MVNLTIYSSDGTKQVTNMSDSVLLDNRNKPLTEDQVKDKFRAIASTIAGPHYTKHVIRY